jgi:hypothetical protein
MTLVCVTPVGASSHSRMVPGVLAASPDAVNVTVWPFAKPVAGLMVAWTETPAAYARAPLARVRIPPTSSTAAIHRYCM